MGYPIYLLIIFHLLIIFDFVVFYAHAAKRRVIFIVERQVKHKSPSISVTKQPTKKSALVSARAKEKI